MINYVGKLRPIERQELFASAQCVIEHKQRYKELFRDAIQEIPGAELNDEEIDHLLSGVDAAFNIDRYEEEVPEADRPGRSGDVVVVELIVAGRTPNSPRTYRISRFRPLLNPIAAISAIYAVFKAASAPADPWLVASAMVVALIAAFGESLHNLDDSAKQTLMALVELKAQGMNAVTVQQVQGENTVLANRDSRFAPLSLNDTEKALTKLRSYQIVESRGHKPGALQPAGAVTVPARWELLEKVIYLSPLGGT